jgi:hypothetical protein
MTRKAFDPRQVRSTLVGDLGIEWQLGRSFEDSKSCGGLSSGAHADLGAAIECILVGLDEPATRLLEKARTWATEAVHSDAEVAGWLTFETLAMCEWLLANRHDSEMYRKLTAHMDRSLAVPSIAKDPLEVSLCLPGYLDANAYERVLDIFEKTPRLVEPDSLAKVRNEAQMCFIIAKHRLGLEYSEPEVTNSCSTFLRKRMDKWLRDGHSVRAAEWMKIVFWNPQQGSLSARDTVLRCYDYLPGCPRPF